MKKILMLWMCLLFPTHVYALEASGPVSIKQIILDHRGNTNYVFVNFPVGTVLNTACTDKDTIVLTAATQEQRDRMYSMVVSAKLANQPVNVYLNLECIYNGAVATVSYIVLE